MFLDMRNFSEATILAYSTDFSIFLSYLEETGVELKLESISKAVVRSYLLWLKSKGYSNASIARKANSLRSFLNYCVNEELIPSSPARDLALLKTDKKIPEYLNKDEVKRLLETLNTKPGRYQLRDKALIYLLIYTGMRRTEVINLDWDDVDFDKGTIKVRGDKGNKDRIVPMNEKLNKVLWTYLKPGLPLRDRALLHSMYGQRITKMPFAAIVKNYVKKAGIKKKVSPHTLRHTFATLML